MLMTALVCNRQRLNEADRLFDSKRTDTMSLSAHSVAASSQVCDLPGASSVYLEQTIESYIVDKKRHADVSLDVFIEYLVLHEQIDSNGAIGTPDTIALKKKDIVSCLFASRVFHRKEREIGIEVKREMSVEFQNDPILLHNWMNEGSFNGAPGLFGPQFQEQQKQWHLNRHKRTSEYFRSIIKEGQKSSIDATKILERLVFNNFMEKNIQAKKRQMVILALKITLGTGFCAFMLGACYKMYFNHGVGGNIGVVSLKLREFFPASQDSSG